MKTMTAKDLKNALLQEAVQGRLVPQCATDGNARTLLDAIRAEKQRNAKSKSSKPLPPIADDEIPFEIPDSWVWVRLGEIINLLSGQDFEPSFYNDKEMGIPYITRASNFSNDKIIVNRWTDAPRCIAERGDLLLVCKGSGYGTMLFADFEKAHIARQIMAIKQIGNFNCLKYVRYFLTTIIKYIKSQGKGVIPGIDRQSVLEILIPLPPLAEQHRIVSAIEKLLPLIDEYGKKELVINALNSTIGQTAKKAILQEAVQGRLVPQCAADGNARALLDAIRAEKQKSAKSKSSKPLPPIADDEIPFDIPDNWVWVRLGEILTTITGLGYKKEVLEIKSEKMIRVLRGGNILDTSYTFKDDDVMISSEFVKESLYLKRNTLITPAVTSLENIGKIGRIEKDYNDTVVGGFVLMLVPYFNDDALSLYILNVFGTQWLRNRCKEITHKSGQAFYNLSREKLLEIPIPLPPLAEQRRIVSAIEKLLPMCERLGKE